MKVIIKIIWLLSAGEESNWSKQIIESKYLKFGKLKIVFTEMIPISNCFYKIEIIIIF